MESVQKRVERQGRKRPGSMQRGSEAADGGEAADTDAEAAAIRRPQAAGPLGNQVAEAPAGANFVGRRLGE